VIILQDKGRPLPKFGEWDVNDPASAEGFTVIFNKARDEKKTGGNPESPGKTATELHSKPAVDPGKPQSVRRSLVFAYIKLTHTVVCCMGSIGKNSLVKHFHNLLWKAY
jgi:hypothetical protein